MNHIQPKEIQTLPYFQVIDNNRDLSKACQNAQQKSAVALDTEFVRIRSFYPKLGLVQLYDGERVSLIDPMGITDFSPFIALLANSKIIKVLHSCSEDLEVFQHYFQQLPTPMIDTQVMANFLGFSHSTGFASLVQHYFQIELDKGVSRTDWLARPLLVKQLNYAAADVWYLLPLYQRMKTELAQTDWQSAVENECELLLQKRQQDKNADLAYLTIPNVWKLEPIELMRLKLLAKWRQQEAIKRDLALNFVVKGENLWLVAKHAPKHTSDLLALGLHQTEVRIHGKKLLQIIEQVKRYTEVDYPKKIIRLTDDPRYKSAIKCLQQTLPKITPASLSPELIASKKSLESLLKWLWKDKDKESNLPNLLQGWRKPYAEQLIQVLEAKNKGE